MADDLKPMLTKVLASGGEKKFFFAYGMGKRKDGKGDGALLVDRKKLKPEQAEDDLEKAGQTFAGTCWSSQDGATVYFAGKGKKLSPMIVAKMALSAKRVVGKQYDFQVPSPEEEARAEKITEGEGDEAPAGAVPPPPPPPQAPPPPVAKPADLQPRLKALALRVKSLYATAPALKERLDPLFQSAVGLVLSGAADAPAALDKLEQALNAVPPAAPEAAPPPPPAPGGMAAFTARAKAVKAAIDPLKEAQPGRYANLAQRLAAAAGLAQAKDFEAAFAALGEVEAAVPGAAPGGEKTDTVGIWVQARDRVTAQMNLLQSAVQRQAQESGDTDFEVIAKQGLAGITKRLQVGLHVALLEFDHATGDTKGPARAKARAVLAEFQKFLDTDKRIPVAEQNPWQIKVEIRSTLGAAFKKLGAALAI